MVVCARNLRTFRAEAQFASLGLRELDRVRPMFYCILTFAIKQCVPMHAVMC